MSVTIINKLPAYQRRLYQVLDDALAEASADILIKSKDIAPKKKGHLRANADTKKIAPLHHRVRYKIEYSVEQEKGYRDTKNGRVYFKRYSEPNTGAHFLEKTADSYSGNKILSQFRKHVKRVRA